jgi:hypothetical protein
VHDAGGSRLQFGVDGDVDGGRRWWRRFTPWRKRGSCWFCGAQSFFGLIRYAAESGGVGGIINVIKETEAKMVLSGCVS